jgi:hypothetical protein
MGFFHLRFKYTPPIAIHLAQRLGRYSLHLSPFSPVSPASLRRLASPMFVPTSFTESRLTPALLV